MHNNKSNRSVSCSDDETEELTYKEPLFASRLFVPSFKQQLMVLENTNTNQYPLIFNRSKQPCITQYLLNGKQVASLLQIGDSINFESNDGKAYNFSLQIPYRTDSLTINTQGRISFDKKVSTCSASLTGKMVDFNDDFISEANLLIQSDSCRNHAQLSSSDFLFKGEKFEVMSKSSLRTHNSLILLAGSLLSNQGAIECKEKSIIKSSWFKNPGTYKAYSLHFDGDNLINQGTLFVRDTFDCISRLFEHSGTLDVCNDCSMKGDVFSARPLSILNIHGNWKSWIAYLYLQGTFNVKDIFLAGKKFTSTSSMQCVAENVCLEMEEGVTNAGIIKVLGEKDLGSFNIDAESIKLEKTSDIVVDNADLKVNKAIENDGTVSVKNHLAAHARSISNGGKIEASSSDIKADRYYYNKILSILNAKNNLTVNTPLFLNVLGFNNAQHFTLNSGIGLNLFGLYRAKNLNINALLTLNAGLLLPKFNSISEMCSRENLLGFGESLFMKYAPVCGPMYGALKSIQGNYQQVKILCSEINSLRKQKNVGASDLIAVICLAKNIFNSGKQAYSAAKQNYRVLSDCSQAYQERGAESLSSIKDTMQQTASLILANPVEVAHQVALDAVSHYGPQVNTSALVDLNGGVALGANNHSTSLYNRNTQTSLYFNNSIDTRWGVNTGYLGGYNLDVRADKSYISDGSIGAFNGNISANDLSIYSSIKAFNTVKLEGKSSVYIGGYKAKVTAPQIEIKSDHKIINNADLISSRAHLDSKYKIEQAGTIIAEQNIMMDGEIVENKSTGTINAPKIMITDTNPGKTWGHEGFYNKGKVQASEQLIVDTKNIKLYQTSQVSAPNAYLKADRELLNRGTINTEQVRIDAGTKVINDGLLKTSVLQVQSEEIQLQKASHIDAKNSYLQANANLKNCGELNSEVLQVKAQNVSLEKTSDITAKNTYFQIDSDLKNEGKLNIAQGLIEAQKDVTNSGVINASELLHIKAQNVFLEKTSATDSYFQRRFGLKNEGKLNVAQALIEAEGNVINSGVIEAQQFKVKAQNLRTQKTSHLTVKDLDVDVAKDVPLDGVTHIEKGTIKAGGKVRTIGKLGASDGLVIKAREIGFERASDTNVNNLSLIATETIDNKSNAFRTTILDAHAKYVTNSGSIITNIGHIKADRYLWNGLLGTIKAEDSLTKDILTKGSLTIDTLALLNTGGYIGSDDYLRTNAIFDLNLLGVYSGYNISRNSIIGVNAGILLPSFKLRLSESEVGWMVSTLYMQQFFPRAYAFCSLLSALGCSLDEKGGSGIWNRAIALYNQYEVLRDKKDLCVSDVVPFLCDAKNLATSVVQTGAQAYNIGQDVCGLAQDTWNSTVQEQQEIKEEQVAASEQKEIIQKQQATKKEKQKIISVNNISPIVSTIVSSLGPCISNSSLLDINAGIMCGMNGNSQSLYNVNTGFSCFANNSINTIAGTNRGILTGGSLSVNALRSYSSQGWLAAGNISMVANDLKVADAYAYNNALFKAHNNAILDREIKAYDITVHAKNIFTRENASIIAQNKANAIATETFIHQGAIEGKETSVKGNEVILKDGSKILAHGNDGAAVVNAELLDMHEGAVVHSGGKTQVRANEHAKIAGSITGNATNVQAKTAEVQKNAYISSETETGVIAEKFTNEGTISGNKTLVNGNEVILKDGSKILAHGSDGVTVVNAELLDMHEGAVVHSGGKTQVRANEHAKIAGSITGNATNVQAKTAEVQKNACISSETETNVIAEKFTNEGTISGNKTLVNGNEVILKDGSKILAHGNDGVAVVNARKLHLKDGSQIDGTMNFIDAQSIQGEKGNTIKSTDGTYIKTNQLDNKGAIQGSTDLDFSGNADQLESIGSVEQLTYSGPLENNIADKLANGHNELLDVARGGSVAVDAKEQDFHLKEKHTMEHALFVQTEGSIKCDKDLESKKSIELQAKENLDHASIRAKETATLRGRNISSKSHVARKTNDNGYEEICEQSVVTGHEVILDAQEDINYKGTRVHSGTGGTKISFGNKLIADTIEIEKYNKTQKDEHGSIRTETVVSSTIVEDTTITHVSTSFSSDGKTSITGNVAELHATEFASREGTTINAKIEDVPTYDTHSQLKVEQENKALGLKQRTTSTESNTQERIPITFNDGEGTHIISDEPVTLTLEGSTPSITIDAPEADIKVAQKATQTIIQKDGKYGYTWERGTNEQSSSITAGTPYSGIINTSAAIIHVEQTKDNAPATINATNPNACINRSIVEDMHANKNQTLYNRPTPEAMKVASLVCSTGISSLVAPFGAGLKIVLTGANAFGFNALSNFVYCEGNYRDAAKNSVSPHAMKTVAAALLISATTFGADRVLDKVIPPISQATTFVERLASAAPREIVNNSIRLVGDIAQGADPKEAAQQHLKLTAASILGIVLTRQIGELYGKGKIDPVTHKLLHTGVGALEGGIIDGKSGAIAGAIGAGVAEFVADVACPKPPTLESMIELEAQYGRPLTQDEFAHEWDKQAVRYLKRAHSVGEASKVIGSTAALLANQDMNIAHSTAIKAVDNNFITLIPGVILGASYLYSAYQIHQTYEKEGFEAAAKHLGVEIVWNAACIGAFKYAGKVYPSAKAAIQVALDKNPPVKAALGNTVESLIIAGEKLTQGISNQAGKIGKYVNPSFAEDLVENIVPRAVINQVEKEATKNVAKKGAEQLALPAPKKFPLLPTPVSSASEVMKESTSVVSQDVSLSMQEIAKQRLAAKNDGQEILNMQVKELFKTTNLEKVGRMIPDDISLVKRAKIEAQAEVFYNTMRTTMDDVSKISKNTNIPQDIIQKIKSHVFVEDHILRYETGRFGVDADMAAAWQRLIDNKFVKSDLILLQHEYAEARIMNGTEIPYDNAHYLVDTLYDWYNSL